MSIKFNVQEIGNALNPEAPKKFYLRPVSSGEMTLDDLATEIAHTSSLTEADVHAVLQALVHAIPRAISDGYIVRLGNLGSFRMSVNSAGSNQKDQVSEASIRKRRLVFYPGKRLKQQLNKIGFVKNS